MCGKGHNPMQCPLQPFNHPHPTMTSLTPAGDWCKALKAHPQKVNPTLGCYGWISDLVRVLAHAHTPPKIDSTDTHPPHAHTHAYTPAARR